MLVKILRPELSHTSHTPWDGVAAVW